MCNHTVLAHTLLSAATATCAHTLLFTGSVDNYLVYTESRQHTVLYNLLRTAIKFHGFACEFRAFYYVQDFKQE